MSIEIWNSKEMPFGSLSNNAVYLMNIDGVDYTTVTNYIYSNLIQNKEYFNVLKTINYQDIYDLFNKYDKDIVDNLISKSLKEGLELKFQDKDLEEILLSTDVYPIIFYSNDKMLGLDNNGYGKNLVGKYLTDIRDNLIVKYSKKDKQLYDSYVALQILEKLIREENNDLSSFSGLNQVEIINKYIYMKALETAKIQKRDISNLPYNTIIEEYKYLLNMPSKNILQTLTEDYKYLTKTTEPIVKNTTEDSKTPETGKNIKNVDNIEKLRLLEASIRNPYILILYAKKKFMNNLRITRLNKIKNNIFDIYVDDIIENKFPELDKNKYQEAKNIEFNIDVLELETLKTQIYELYKEQLLNDNVMEKINNSVTMNLIRDDIVENLEKIDIQYMYKDRKKDDLVISFESYSRIEETPYYVLSPFVYTNKMLTINGKKYPTVMHYVMTNLLSILPEIKSVDNAHKYILYDREGDVNNKLNYKDYTDIFYMYEDEKFHQFNNLRKKLATVSINKKFEDIGLKELLLATGYNELKWNDPHDDLLGVGFSKGGDNFVGKYLMELRNTLRENEDEIEKISEKDVKVIMENDVFMRNWTEMRLGDICRVVKEIKKYIENKYKKNIEIDYTLIKNVIDNIYESCHDIKDFEGDTKPPEYFIESVKKCFGNKNTYYDIIELLWGRIIGMIYFVSKYTPKLKNMKNVLTKIELMVSQNTNCVQIINNNYDNCIISAIVNIIKKLSNFNEIQGNDTLISKHDVEAAINIILNKGKTVQIYEEFIPNFSIENEEEEDEPQEEDKEYYDIVVADDDEELDEDDNELVDYVYEDDEEPADYGNKKAKMMYDFSGFPSRTKREGSILLKDIKMIPYVEKPELKSIIEQIEVEVEEDEDIPKNTKKRSLTPKSRRRGNFRKNRSRSNLDRWERINEEIQMDLERKERKRFEKYKNINKIVLYLEENKIISTNNNSLAEYIINAVNIIKKYKMSYKVKMNRINFFATTV